MLNNESQETRDNVVLDLGNEFRELRVVNNSLVVIDCIPAGTA